MHTKSKDTAVRAGASAGIGAIDADRLARRGHDGILVARHRERPGAVATRLTDDPGRAVEGIIVELHRRPSCGLKFLLAAIHKSSLLTQPLTSYAYLGEYKGA